MKCPGWCLQPAVKLDFRHFDDGYVATAADVKRELDRIGHELRPLEIVLVNTSAGAHYGQPTTSAKGAVWGARRPCTYWSAVCASPGPTRGAGTPVLPTPPALRAHPTTRRSSGRVTRAGRTIGYRHIEKFAQPRSFADRRLRGVVFSGEGPRGLSGMDPRWRSSTSDGWARSSRCSTALVPRRHRRPRLTPNCLASSAANAAHRRLDSRRTVSLLLRRKRGGIVDSTQPVNFPLRIRRPPSTPARASGDDDVGVRHEVDVARAILVGHRGRDHLDGVEPGLCLFSERMMIHGASGVLVRRSMRYLASVKSSPVLWAWTSISLSFHWAQRIVAAAVEPTACSSWSR